MNSKGAIQWPTIDVDDGELRFSDKVGHGSQVKLLYFGTEPKKSSKTGQLFNVNSAFLHVSLLEQFIFSDFDAVLSEDHAKTG